MHQVLSDTCVVVINPGVQICMGIRNENSFQARNLQPIFVLYGLNLFHSIMLIWQYDNKS